MIKRASVPTGLGMVAMFGLVVVTAAVCLVEIALFNVLSWAQCPSEAFFAGVTASFGLGGLVTTTAVMLFASFSTVVQSVPSLREKLYVSTGPIVRSAPWTQRMVPFFALAAVALVYAGYAIVTPFCLTDQGVTYRERPWTAMTVHAWNDLSSIETGCEPVKNGWRLSYRLTMKDGTRLNVLGNELMSDKFYANFAQFDRAVSGHGFRFDATRVSPNCADPNAVYVKYRP